jgi:hypothetical protein
MCCPVNKKKKRPTQTLSEHDALGHLISPPPPALHSLLPLPPSPPPHRSYQGFTCLLQLSTRDADWVVDTLALRAQLGPALAPLLAHPGVEKVLHGADNDVLWLQVRHPGAV